MAPMGSNQLRYGAPGPHPPLDAAAADVGDSGGGAAGDKVPPMHSLLLRRMGTHPGGASGADTQAQYPNGPQLVAASPHALRQPQDQGTSPLSGPPFPEAASAQRGVAAVTGPPRPAPGAQSGALTALVAAVAGSPRPTPGTCLAVPKATNQPVAALDSIAAGPSPFCGAVAAAEVSGEPRREWAPTPVGVEVIVISDSDSVPSSAAATPVMPAAFLIPRPCCGLP